ncbi:MAG: GntR family transcriptional regulator [Deltaproteobacteria bacterium]|nr:GntR family transcriptional regulator [Deltaproteobacteria bacterium]
MQNCIQVAAMGPKSPGSRSLFRTVYDKIRQDIVLARLQPGEPLLEEDLAKRLQVSRTPIREALKSDERLSAALGELGRIEEKLTRTKASHIHGFVRLRETEAMVAAAKLIFTASRVRQESRLSHIREDYSKRDDRNWLRWVLIRQQGDQPQISTEPIATPLVPAPNRSSP